MPRRPVLLLLGLVLVALNLRLALTSVGPLIDQIRADVGLSAAAVGLLTTLPLLAFGLAAPFAAGLAERFGTERVVLACLAAIAAGLALRLPAPVALLFGGTLVTGCGIALANVLLPAIVKRRFPGRAAFMTGVYSVALTAGAAIAAGLTVPLERWLGDWRLALAIWALPAVAAAIVWLPEVRRAAPPAPAGAGVPRPAARRLGRDRRAWEVSVAMGLQSLVFYVTVAWLPEILRDDAGLSSGSAGLIYSLTMLMGMPVGLAMSVAAGRMRDQRPLAAFTIGVTAIGWLGLLAVPTAAPLLWSLLLGVGEGGCFTLVLTLFVLRARDARDAAALSGMAQAIGYTLAAAGPFAIGALHDLGGGWTAPLVALLAVTAVQMAVTLAASRAGYVGAPPAAPAGTSTPAVTL